MNKTEMTPEQRRDRLNKWLKIAACCALGLGVSHIVLAMITGLLGLFACLVIVLGAWTVTPWLTMACANWRLQMIKAEAMRKPSLTMQNELLEREGALDMAAKKIERQKGRLDAFNGRIDDLRPRLKAAAISKMVEAARGLECLYDANIKKYEDAKVALEEYRQTVDQADAEWEAIMATEEARAAFVQTKGDPMSNLKVNTALNEIRTRLGSAMASLDVAMADEAAEKRIMDGAGQAALPPPHEKDVIDAVITGTDEVKEKVPNRRSNR